MAGRLGAAERAYGPSHNFYVRQQYTGGQQLQQGRLSASSQWVIATHVLVQANAFGRSPQNVSHGCRAMQQDPPTTSFEQQLEDLAGRVEKLSRDNSTMKLENASLRQPVSRLAELVAMVVMGAPAGSESISLRSAAQVVASSPLATCAANGNTSVGKRPV